jgi:hypothetical protein
MKELYVIFALFEKTRRGFAITIAVDGDGKPQTVRAEARLP